MVIGFEYKGVHGSEYGIYCKTEKRSLLPAVRRREFEIFGKSGIIDLGDNDYMHKIMTAKLTYVGNSLVELRNRARDIAAWLNSTRWEKLIFDDEPDKYYLARVKNGIDLNNILMTGEMSVNFECQPFAYMCTSTGADPTWDEADFPWITEIPWNMVQSYQFSATGTTNYTFEHPGTQEIGCNSPQGSKFDIVISGSWTTLEISMNGKTLEFTEAGTGTLVIDNVDMEVKLNGLNKLSALDGDIDSFLNIVPGENTIGVSGTGLNITVTIDFIPQWL